MNGWNRIVSLSGRLVSLFSGANLPKAVSFGKWRDLPNQNQSEPTPSCDLKDLRFGVLTSWDPQTPFPSNAKISGSREVENDNPPKRSQN